MKAALRVLSLAIPLAVLWSVLRWAPVRADTTQLDLLVARVAFNEAADSCPDAAMIWQVVEGHADTDRGRLRWLSWHSRCVSGRLTQDEAYRRPGRCRWTRNLHPDGRRPRGWNRSPRARSGAGRRPRRHETLRDTARDVGRCALGGVSACAGVGARGMLAGYAECGIREG